MKRRDILSKADRSKRMALIKGKNTSPELTVRKIASSLGYRYRLNDASLPGKPDLVFKKLKKVIFVNGCFWHLHDCGTYRMPRTRRSFWLPKLKRNVERDRESRKALRKKGWRILTIWECQLKKGNLEKLQRRIAKFLQS